MSHGSKKKWGISKLAKTIEPQSKREINPVQMRLRTLMAWMPSSSLQGLCLRRFAEVFAHRPPGRRWYDSPRQVKHSDPCHL